MGYRIGTTEASADIYDLTAGRYIQPENPAQRAMSDAKTPAWVKDVATSRPNCRPSSSARKPLPTVRRTSRPPTSHWPSPSN